MSENKGYLTEPMVTVLRSWGWKFQGNGPINSKWYKYRNSILVATGGSKAWDSDVIVARGLLARNETKSSLDGSLSQPVIDLMEGMGWEWMMTCHDAWEWLKFDSTGTMVARQSGQCWDNDLESAKLLVTGKEPEVWEPTMELRHWKDHIWCNETHLQQKWKRVSGGSTEWRPVPTVDASGKVRS